MTNVLGATDPTRYTLPDPSTETIEKMKKENSPRRFDIVAQPTETTCGPTCLHAVYQYLGDGISLMEVIEDIAEIDHGGTYAVMLANHALGRGYQAKIYSYNLRIFDPTWYDLAPASLQDKLAQRRDSVTSAKLRIKLKAYIEFLGLGGEMRFDELTTDLLRELLEAEAPVISGLNSTHLYRDSRTNRNGKDDDVRGEAEGHFVSLFQYDTIKDEILVADPYQKNPLSETLIYSIEPQRLINSIMLGIVTYDANLLIIEPRSK